MAKLATLVSKDSAKLTDAEKATVKADKAIVAILKSGDASTLNRFFARVAEVDAVLNQKGDYKGKRFSGSTGHQFDENVAAYADTVLRGMIAKIS